MSEQRNIVVVGASTAGLQAAHYVLKHILPALKAKGDAKYHVYLINPSTKWYFRVASPRAAASSDRLATEKIIFDIHEGFKAYSPNDYTFVEATATGLNKNTRTLSYKGAKAVESDSITYHALIVATGTSANYPAFSMSGATQSTIDAVKLTNEKVKSAKDIVIGGGGATSIEFAGEVAELHNGKPGWFSNAKRNVNITVVASADRLVPQLGPAVGKAAERRLKSFNVNVKYNSRVINAAEGKDGRTTLTFANGETYETDCYVPAFGVTPNSSWLPGDLLDEKKYLKNNHETLRVEAAGPRVYAFGDIGSYSRNNIFDVLNAAPVLAVNMKRDLLAYNAANPDAKPKGKDRLLKADLRDSIVMPIGSGGGVGIIMGWKLPSFLVALFKGRDFMVGMSGMPTVTGKMAQKEVKWTAEEAAI